MGFLRFILAVAVVLAHAHQKATFEILPAHVAVTTFFMISGFYMGLVLETKYGSKYGIFVTSRALRIYPLYFLILGGALFLFLGTSIWKGHPIDRLVFYDQAWAAGNWGVLVFLAIIQFTLIGADLPCLLSYSPVDGVHLLSSSTELKGILMERMLFLPHTWTISFELIFYLLIPWLAKFKSRYLIILTIASLLLKIGIRGFFTDFGPGKFDNQFLPPQFAFFLIGFLAYRHRSLLLTFSFKKLLPWALACLAVLFVFWSFVSYSLAEFIWFGGIAAILPGLFSLTSNWRFDSWLGELSYPIYLIHIPVRWIMLGPSSSYGDGVSPMLYLLLSILAGIALASTVEKWLERFRANFISRLLKKTSA